MTRESLMRAATTAWCLVVIGVLAWGAWHVCGTVSVVLVPLMVAFLLAAALSPTVDRLERLRVPRWLGAGALLSCLVGLAAGAVGAFAYGASDLESFRTNLRRGYAQLSVKVGDALPFVHAGDVRRFTESALNDAGEHLANDATTVLTGMTTVGSAAVGVTLTLLFAFFFLKDGSGLADRYLALLESSNARAVRRLGRRAWEKSGAYVRSVALVAAINASVTGLVMWGLGVPMVAPVVVLTFLGSFIPFAGAIVSGVLAVLLAFASRGVGVAGIMFAVSFTLQMLEGNVFQPLLIGRSVELHSVAVLVAVGVGGAVGGVAGAALAAPVAAVALSLWRESRDRRETEDERELGPLEQTDAAAA